PFEATDAASFWRACQGIYERTLRFLLANPGNRDVFLSISRARERLEGHPVLLSHQERMLEWTRELVTQGQKIGAVRTDVPTDLLVHAALSLMDAGDRWLATRWTEMTTEAVESTSKTMMDLFRR